MHRVIFIDRFCLFAGISAKCDTGTIMYPSGNVKWVTDSKNTRQCSSIFLGGVSLLTNKPHGYSSTSVAFMPSFREYFFYQNLCHPNVQTAQKSTYRSHTKTSTAKRHVTSSADSFRCFTSPYHTDPAAVTTTSSFNDVDVMSSQSDNNLSTKSVFFSSTEPSTGTSAEDTISKTSNNILTPFRSSSAGSSVSPTDAFTYTTLKEIFETADTAKTSLAASPLTNYHSVSSKTSISTTNIVSVKTTDALLPRTSKYTPPYSMEATNSHSAMTNSWFHLSTYSQSLKTNPDRFLQTSTSWDNKGTISMPQKMTTVRHEITTQQEGTIVTTSPFVPTTLANSFLTTKMSTTTKKKNGPKKAEEG